MSKLGLTMKIDKRKYGILILVYADIREPDGFTSRVESLIEILRQEVYTVEGLWCVPLASFLKRGARWSIDINNMQWFIMPVLPAFRQKFIRRLVEKLCAVMVRILCWKHKIDAIQVENPRSARLAAISGRPIILDIHGDRVSEVTMSVKAKKVHKREIANTASYERFAIKKSTAIISASESLLKLMTLRYGSLPRSEVVGCNVDVARFIKGWNSRFSVRNNLRFENRIVLCYLGGLSLWQNVPMTIELVAKLRALEPKIAFLLITQGNTKNIHSQLDAIGEEKKDYYCISASSNEVPGLLTAADVGFLLRSDNPVNIVSSPTKCGEYLAGGVPVVATRFAGDASIIIEEEHVGMILEDVRPTSTELINMVEFARDVSVQRDLWADRCVKAAQQHKSLSATKKGLRNIYKFVFENM